MIRIEGVDGHGLLTIKSASKYFHDAWYTATAVNKAGRDLTRCRIAVEQIDSIPDEDPKLFIPKVKKQVSATSSSPERMDLRKVRILFLSLTSKLFVEVLVDVFFLTICLFVCC